ncbi:uncharacterized protein LOC108931298 isoform X1 [Arapaima gigas]
MSSPTSLLLLLLLVDSGPAKTGAQGQKPKIDVNVKVVPVDGSLTVTLSELSDEITVFVYSTRIEARLTVTPTVLGVTDSVSLQCEGPQSELLSGSHCWFLSNDSKLNEVPTDCQLSLSGHRLVSGELGVVNLVNLQCSYTESRDGFDVPSVRSGPVSVTVYSLVKPNIRVSRQDTQLLVHCEAPAFVTGTAFYLLKDGNLSYTDTVRAAPGETSVTFHAAYRSPSVKYCCRYQYRQVNSDLSDCTGEQHTGGAMTVLRHVAAALILLAALGFVAEHVVSHRRGGSASPPTAPLIISWTPSMNRPASYGFLSLRVDIDTGVQNLVLHAEPQ